MSEPYRHLAKADPACAEGVKKSITALDMFKANIYMAKKGGNPGAKMVGRVHEALQGS